MKKKGTTCNRIGQTKQHNTHAIIKQPLCGCSAGQPKDRLLKNLARRPNQTPAHSNANPQYAQRHQVHLELPEQSMLCEPCANPTALLKRFGREHFEHLLESGGRKSNVFHCLPTRTERDSTNLDLDSDEMMSTGKTTGNKGTTQLEESARPPRSGCQRSGMFI